MRAGGPALAGVDGCRAGWIAAIERAGNPPALFCAPCFAAILDALPDDAVIAVDMPIGLPERITGPGRAAEQAGRALLRARRASLFSIPARAAVEAGAGPFADASGRRSAFERAGHLARERSEPSKGFSIQAFGIFPKIAEIDRLLRERPSLRDRVIESHPELAFATLNAGAEMAAAKKTEEGVGERRAVLERHGFERALLRRELSAGVARDDWLDACVMLLVARRYASGEARSLPDPPGRDAYGLPVAIWV